MADPGRLSRYEHRPAAAERAPPAGWGNLVVVAVNPGAAPRPHPTPVELWHHAVPATDTLRHIGQAAGLDAVGVTTAGAFSAAFRILEERRAAGLSGGMAFTYRNPSRSTEPDRIVPGARSIVVGARSYLRQPPPGDPGSLPPAGDDLPAAAPVYARVARYAWVDHYRALRQALDAVAGHLVAAGWRARAVADDNALVDRAAAARAGIGWYGKNCNILLPGAGSWFVLGSVVTDAPLPPDQPLADGCGTCSRCLDACPTGALVAPGVLDARRCLAWLVQAPGVFPFEHRVALGDRIYGCDDCQEVCPPNRRAARRLAPAPPDSHAGPEPDDPEPEPDDPGAGPLVDVLALLAATDAELLARYGRWYIPRRDPRYLRRNALLVLGNAGRRDDPRVLAALGAALASADPLLRAHAVWAAARLRVPALLAAVRDDPDPLVAEELRRVPEVPVRTP